MSTALFNRRSLLRDLADAQWQSEQERQQLILAFRRVDALPVEGLLKVLHQAGLVHDVRRRDAIYRTVVEILVNTRDEKVVEPLLQLCLAADGLVHEAAAAVVPRLATRKSLPHVVELLRSSVPAVRKLGRDILEGFADKPQAVRALAAHLRRFRKGSRGEDVALLCKLSPHGGAEVVAEIFDTFSMTERVAVCKSLAASPPDIAGPVLLNVMATEKLADVRLAAADSLGMLQYKQAADAVADLLSTEDARHVDRIVRVLSQLGDERSEVHMVRLLKNGDNRVRLRAIRTLGEVGGAEALSPLVMLLGSEDGLLRQAAAESVFNLLEQGTPAVMGRCLELLCARESGVAVAIQDILRKQSPQKLVPGMMAALTKVSWNVREQAAEKLVRLWNVDLTPYFYRFLREEDAALRRFGVEMIARLNVAREAIPYLVPLLSDGDWWVRERAVAALGRTRDRSVVPHLVRLLQADPELHCMTAHALGEVGDPEALAPLLQAFETADTDAQVAMVLAIGKLEGDSAKDILEGLYQRADKEVQGAISEALTRMRKREAGGETAAPALDRLLLFTQERGGTDLFVPCDGPPMVRKNGKLIPALNRALTPEQSRNLIFEVLTPEQQRIFELHNDLDFGYEIPYRGRFRANVYRQRNGITAVFRVIPSRIPSAQELGLPEVAYEMVQARQGLVLVTGAAGSGKSTTLAALIDHINAQRPCHIITLEHPIEFIHRNNVALVTQREVGVHARSYASALRAALREDPDVIMVGELKDMETVGMAITAAETGHMVLGTLNTQGSVRTVDRLVNFYAAEEQSQVRTMLADVLRGVISQQLVWRKDNTGRVVAVEVLVGDYRIAKLIRDNKSYQIPNVMAVAAGRGMRTMDQSLQELVESGMISAQEAYRRANDRKSFRQYFEDGELPPELEDQEISAEEIGTGGGAAEV